MPLLHTLPVRGQALSLNLIFHPGPDSPRLPDGKLPLVGPDILGRLWRALDDWPADRGVGGISASRITLIGLRVSSRTITFKNSELVIPRNTPLIAVRSATGRVTGLLTPEKWLTAPTIHCSNLIRKHWTQTVEVFPSVLEAELAALERNVAVVALNGVDLAQLSQRITGPSPRIVAEMERAA
jgi:hypothetical protein